MPKETPTILEKLCADQKFRDAVLAEKSARELFFEFSSYGASERTLSRAVRKEKNRIKGNLADQPPAPAQEEIHERTSDTWVATLKNTRIQSLDELIKHCEIDTDVWEVERWVCNKWEAYARSADTGQIVTEPLFQVKAWLKRKKDAFLFQAIEGLISKMEDHAPKYSPFVRIPKVCGGHCFELSIFDPHFGKLCWGDETGGANYDVDIAIRLYEDAVEQLLQKASAYQIDRILLPIGNDTLHSDSTRNATWSGTVLDVDGRYQRTYERVVKLFVRILERLSTVAKVDVIPVPGNHDRESIFHLSQVLRAWFRNCPDINIRDGAKSRQYYSYGRNLILFTHGCDEKPISKLSEIAAAEEPELWGKSIYREAHIGHFHTHTAQDRPGLRIRTIPSLCPPDAWHARSGYVGNFRSAEGFVWDAQGGVAAHLYHHLLTGDKVDV